jgi:hypothetical protein
MARAGVMPNVNDPTWVNLMSRFADRMYRQGDQDTKFAERTSDLIMGETLRRQDVANEPDRIYNRQRASGQAQLDTQSDAVERGLRPNPGTTNRRYNGRLNPDLDAAIVRQAEAAGRPDLVNYLRRNAVVESSGGYNLANPNSSARGPWQFIRSTGQQYGLNTDADRMDFNKSTQAMIQFTTDNENTLRQAGIEPSPPNLYLAHQQGAGTAVRLIRNPNAPLTSIISGDAARLNRGDNTMTAGKFVSQWQQRFGIADTNRRDPSNAAFRSRTAEPQ